MLDAGLFAGMEPAWTPGVGRLCSAHPRRPHPRETGKQGTYMYSTILRTHADAQIHRYSNCHATVP